MAVTAMPVLSHALSEAEGGVEGRTVVPVPTAAPSWACRRAVAVYTRRPLLGAVSIASPFSIGLPSASVRPVLSPVRRLG